jgi:hypothetical protein
MTRDGLVLGLALVLALAACGGSSSETPPPLQPDPKGFYYAGVSAERERDTADGGTEPSLVTDTDDDDKPHAPARSTWGAAAPHH